MFIFVGTFGEILSGAYRIPNTMESQDSLLKESTPTVPILIKTIKKMASESQRKKFLEEGLSFHSVAPFPNVSQAIAVFIECKEAETLNPATDAVFLCYAHAGYGNLKKFLLRLVQHCHCTVDFFNWKKIQKKNFSKNFQKFKKKSKSTVVYYCSFSFTVTWKKCKYFQMQRCRARQCTKSEDTRCGLYGTAND